MEDHWTGRDGAAWLRLIAPLRDRRSEILEVGTNRGDSAVWFLTALPLARITCIDTFTAETWAGPDPDEAIKEAQFDANVSRFGDRVEKIKSRSFAALDRLAQDGRQFDLIYIDGSHYRDDVLVDSVLAWRVVKPDGLLVWDDYLAARWRLPSERPKQAIDAFLALHRNDLTIEEIGYQVFVRRRPWSEQWSPMLETTFPRTLRNCFRFLAKRPLTHDLSNPSPFAE